MRQLALLVAVLLATAAPGVVLADVDRTGAPLADAGLDQTVERDTTVFLDGTGSRDPDGTVVGYEWRIETPAGDVVTPRDPTDPRTSFLAREPGRYVVTLTVTDDAGETASDSLYVDVGVGPRSTSTPSTPTPVPTSTASAPPTATTSDPSSPAPPAPPSTTTTPTATPTTGTATPTVTRSPTIRGPRLVTGDRPLEASYTVDTAGSVDRVEWRVDGTARSSGTTTDLTFAPGNHTLRAAVTYSDGRTEIATFEDGATGVVADPKPDVTLANLERRQRIGGTASATDEYGNLDSVSVTVEGLGTERVATEGSSDEVTFDWDDIEPGREYELVVTATDNRGQETTVRRTVTPVAPPETISAEFVNGPVDSYHSRIDPGRYTAHHVMKIELNGNSVDDIRVNHFAQKPGKTRLISESALSSSDGIATIHTYWGG
ncbi:PKD domain-containing protein [Halomarina rubra]|uniref:PKD domain-containing protein n=1 Tax=Halomarina rubra TaxID=2071873 RepID=A0ABD6B0E4_9EURY|nr:PKD domain-containing protein [Halomarina rubra]